MQGLLGRATRADISEDPFPHLVVHHALDDALYEQLAAEFPRRGVMRQLQPGKFAYEARNSIADRRLDPSWHAFVAYHVSAEFFRQIIALFGDWIRALHPDLEKRLGTQLEDLRSGVRFVDGQKEVAVEAQCIYTRRRTSPPGSSDRTWTGRSPYMPAFTTSGQMETTRRGVIWSYREERAVSVSHRLGRGRYPNISWRQSR